MDCNSSFSIDLARQAEFRSVPKQPVTSLGTSPVPDPYRFPSELYLRFLSYWYGIWACFITASVWGSANLARVTSPPNSTPRRFPSYLLFTILLYFLSIFYHPRWTLLDFPSVFSLASLPFLYCCHRTTSTWNQGEWETVF